MMNFSLIRLDQELNSFLKPRGCYHVLSYLAYKTFAGQFVSGALKLCFLAWPFVKVRNHEFIQTEI